jgi:CSLREA domain-containing protein
VEAITFRFLLLTALVISFLTFTTPAHAAGIVVNSLVDSEGSNGQCTLREAIQNANLDAAIFPDCAAGSGADTITFSVSGTIGLGLQLPNITAAAGLTLDGTGRTLTISGNQMVRVMQVVAGASLTLNNLTITNGVAPASSGGGVRNDGTLTVTNSTFSDNSAPSGGSGGGISNASGALTVTNSTFSGNTANFGGGILNSSGTLTIANSTFSGNPATGGGVYNVGGTATLRNTIVANSGSNCGGAIINGGNNIDDGTTCGWGTVSGSMSSTNPSLGGLANNGGPTRTFALLSGSPAIDGVTFSAPNSAPSTDQRGVTRPQGVRYDIGAFEGSETQAGPAYIVNTSADTNDGLCDTLGQGLGNQDCTLREAITAANALAGANTVTFSVSAPIVLGLQLPNITAAAGLTLDGTGQTLTISGNELVRVLRVDAGASLTLNNLTIANGYAGASIGGGVRNDGTLTVTNSTFSGNTADNGGGIHNSSGTVTITNSTFSGNNSGLGGGVFAGGTLTITNSTFSGNYAAAGAGAGGAVYKDQGGSATLRNTIVAKSLGDNNCGGGFFTNGGNNIDDGTTCGWGAVSGSMSSTNPQLGALANNGGPTRTFAPFRSSPAIDGVTANAPNSAPSTDQRGVARPQGVRYDIGAFEGFATQAGPALIVNASADTNDGWCDIPGQGIGNRDCTLREAIDAANAMAGANTVTFSVTGPIVLGSQLPSITAAAGLTLDGTGQTLTISGNNVVRVMQVVAGASLTLNNLTIANGTAPTTANFGGGIFNSGTLIVTNSTLSGNSATFSGGAIDNNGGGQSIITNSTFSGNSATFGVGGGISNASGTSTITNSTFSGNSATNGSGAAIYHGGGTTTIRNSIVANSLGAAGNCSGTIINGGNNIDDGTTCGWAAVSGSMSSTNPLLAGLANNGGRTQTFALLPGSPAIDGVTFSAPNGAPSTDQRGFARPRVVRYDIGAYETQFTDDPLTVGITTVKAVHVTELRIRIDAVRIARGLSGYAWTDSSLDPGASFIRAQHIIDLRTALGQAYVQAGRTPPTYATDPPPDLAPGVVVKAAHLAEIRAAILAIE